MALLGLVADRLLDIHVKRMRTFMSILGRLLTRRQRGEGIPMHPLVPLIVTAHTFSHYSRAVVHYRTGCCRP